MREDRRITLLKACHAMLKKIEQGHAMSPFETTVFYDGADCDGACLMEDIETELAEHGVEVEGGDLSEEER